MGQKHNSFPAFPYHPYSIQIDFMNSLYQSLEKGGIAMLQSPTGTGKTLSIICSALQWLVDKREKEKVKEGGSMVKVNENGNSENRCDSDDEPDWVKSFVVKNEVSPKKSIDKKKFGVRSKKCDSDKEKEGRVRDLSGHGGEEDGAKEGDLGKKGRRVKGVDGEGDDEEFLVDEYNSEDEDGKCCKRKGTSRALAGSSSEEDENEDEHQLKIYFCSRTHSQLTQFINELKKTQFASELKVVCLGSRKNMCINEEVLRLGNPTRINERCLELQRNKNKGTSKTKNVCVGGRVRKTKITGCPMLRSHKFEKEFRNEVSQQGPLDIEDVVQIGSKLGTCPYYGSRSLLPEADLIVLPYQSLLSKHSRESLNLTLKNNIIIIDEAHNLADSLISMYDSKITQSQLENVHLHLDKYLLRFRNLLGPGNRRYIQTLLVLTQAFRKILCVENNAKITDPLCDLAGAANAFNYSMSINEFLFSHNIDNINLVKVLQYIEESNIIHKVSGYGEKLAVSENPSSYENNEDTSTLSSFRALTAMLLSLTYKDGDGRIIVSRTHTTGTGQNNGSLKYVMLTGEKIFHELHDTW
ncbi:hypothetical protein Leryth_001607 [Lithospermum erythrorhizon]|nr:hypothetical protein Leryth_001607 [Lithospermum erythrorhizon]